MGHIKEPKGIDFVINSGTLSNKDRAEISRYIREYKLKTATDKLQTKKVRRRSIKIIA